MVSKVLSLLDEKKELFEKYEEQTVMMLDADVEMLEQLFERRVGLAKKIDEVDKLIKSECETPVQFSASRNQCNRGEITGEIVEIYDKAQPIFTVITRIVNVEPLVISKIKQYKKEAEDEIKKTHHTPKISKYLGNPSSKVEFYVGKI